MLIFLLLIYSLRIIPYRMPVIRQMLGPWGELESSIWFLPISFISVLLLYTWFNRVPDAGVFWRTVWRNGRWLLIAAYLWSLSVLFWLNMPVIFRPEHRSFEAVWLLICIDLLALAYLAKSKHVRDEFAFFPQPVDLEAQRNEAKEKVSSRQQLFRDAMLNVPIAQTTEQQRLEAQWRAAIFSQPANAVPWLELGVLAYHCGQLEQAQILMEQALICEPKNPGVLRNLCELSRQKGCFQRALDYGERAVMLAPNDEIARLNLAQVLVDLKETNRAMREYHRILDLNPQHVQTWMNLAVLLLEQQRHVDASSALDAVLVLEPTNTQAHALRLKL